MNSPYQQPVPRPKQFISSVFDLAYGARDGSEPLSAAEVKAYLQEAGIDPDVAWKAASALFSVSAKTTSLAEARKRRLAAATAHVTLGIVRTRSSLIEQIHQMLSLLEPNTGAVFARKWEESTAEDLSALCEQLKRQIERCKEDEQHQQ
jgi:hypothetical protein